MVQRLNEPVSAAAVPRVPGARILLLEAPYYPAIVGRLVEGALAAVSAAGATAGRLTVPGALELPQALAALIAADRLGRRAGQRTYDGVAVLGCVIRGETAHYDVVVGNTNQFLMKLAVKYGVPLGNALLTVDSEAQALARANADKGGDAARACLRLIEIERALKAGAEG